MDTLFRPVMGLLDRFRYPWKFASICIVGVLGILALFAQVYQSLIEEIRFTQQEIAGLTLLDKGFAVLVLSQQHRGLSSGLLGGSEDLRPRVADRARALGEAMANVEAELGMTQAQLRDRLNRAMSANDALRGPLGGAITEVDAAIGRLRDTAVSEVLGRRFSIPPAAFFDTGTAAIDVVLKHYRDTVLPSAQALAERSGQISHEGGEVMQRTVGEMERIAEAVNASAVAVGELGDKARQISSMVEAIKQIAEQTNLLALNAAIEAARAGESGRGFAVVADEVRKLAERTAGATQEITQMSGSIQQGTERAVQAMQQGVVRVRDGAELTTRAGRSMEEINAGAQEVLRAVSEISFALREQSGASADIARNVERIARMSEDNSVAVNETAQTAGMLESLASGLERKVERFQV